MTDSDTQSGPSVTLDPNGHVLLPYNSIAYLNDSEYLVTPISGAAFVVPRNQFVVGDPGVQTSGGTVTVSESWMRSINVI